MSVVKFRRNSGAFLRESAPEFRRNIGDTRADPYGCSL
jgi:hypothetical protein